MVLPPTVMLSIRKTKILAMSYIIELIKNNSKVKNKQQTKIFEIIVFQKISGPKLLGMTYFCNLNSYIPTFKFMCVVHVTSYFKKGYDQSLSRDVGPVESPTLIPIKGVRINIHSVVEF